MMSLAAKKDLARVMATFLATTLLTFYFAAGAVGRMDGTALDAPAHRERLARIFPQGWAFFTKSPTSPRLFLYASVADHWQQVPLVHGIGWDSRFGFRRASRTAGRELGMISSEILPFEWFDCETDVAECLPEPPVTAEVAQLPAVFDGLCGEVAIVTQPPTPWGWRTTSAQMPSRFAKFEVPCK